MLTVDLLVNALVAGALLGGFYAVMSIGISLSFGLLGIANIAHSAFAVLSGYGTWILHANLGIDPLAAAMVLFPCFYGLGFTVYRLYHWAFEREGDQSLQGLVFFFGALFLIEVFLIFGYGSDYRSVETTYTQQSITLGFVTLPGRLLVPFAIAILVTAALYVFLTRTFVGRMILGVSQDGLAVRLMGADPVRMQTIAFALSIATAAIAGALMVMIFPVEPSQGRDFIGRIFAIAILGGMGSVTGTFAAAIGIGVIESLTSTYFGPAWSLVASFGVLLAVLAVRPAGLLGR
jgi:branched-chain amino acid transport system permease protein